MKSRTHYIIALAALALAMPSAQARTADADNVIKSVKQRLAPDKRQEIFEITPTYNADSSSVILSGKLSERETYNSLIGELRQNNVNFVDSVTVFDANRWAQTRLSAACMRVEPGNAKEMATQSLMGTPLRLLEKVGEWWRVQTPDGYISYINQSGLVEKTADELAAWRSADRLIVTNPYQTRAYTTKKATGVREVVTDLVNGDIVVGKIKKGDKRVLVTLPDGREGWVDAKDLTPIETWAAQDFNPDVILDMAYSMEGTPYLWGGMSPKTLDCSGLARVSYFANAIILMRDASQQALTGTRIEAADWRTCQPGDLLFFGNAKTQRVTHVAVYDHDGNYVHSSGRVKRNSVDPDSEAYLTTPFLWAVRINGNIGTKGITRVANHPWYFNQK